MLASGSSFLTSAVFWTAAGVVVAAVVGLAPLARGTSWRYIGLQKLLNRERSFYEDCKGYRPKSERLDPAEDLAESYFGAVDAGLGGIGLLSRTQHREAKSKLQELILNLQRTHQTLVNALESFASQDAKAQELATRREQT